MFFPTSQKRRRSKFDVRKFLGYLRATLSMAKACRALDELSSDVLSLLVTGLLLICPRSILPMNKQGGEGTVRWLAVVVVLAAISNLGSAYCTRSTCPPGPVMVEFQYLNCSGQASFIPIPPLRGQWGVCFKVPGMTFSFLDYYTSEYLENSGYLSDDCGVSGSGATKVGERFYFGNCIAGAGVMYLENVNQSYVSPQPLEKNPRPQPPFLPLEKPCSTKLPVRALEIRLPSIFRKLLAPTNNLSGPLRPTSSCTRVIRRTNWLMSAVDVWDPIPLNK